MAIAASILAIPSASFPIGAAIGIWGLVLLLRNENADAYRALSA
jgi:hypothetical protein